MNAPVLDNVTTGEEVERLVGAARDALTDEMVGRLAAAAGEGLEFIDQVNRAGLNKAIPALAQIVNNGDLDRLVQLARLYGAAQDALTDEMIGRIAETIGNGMSLLDRFNRAGSDRLMQILERLEASGALQQLAIVLPKLVERLDQVERILNCVEEAAHSSEEAVVPTGGLSSLWSLLKDVENQKSLRFLIMVGRQMSTACVRGR